MEYCAPRGIAHSEFLSWDECDQDKALEWAREQATVCSGCGTRKVEWERDRFAYVTDAFICSGCELVEQERENIPEKAKGVRIRLLPRAVAEAMEADGDA